MTTAMTWIKRHTTGQIRLGPGDDVLRLSHRLVALHAGGIVLLLGVVLSTALWLSSQQNQLAVYSSQKLVSNEIAALRESALTLVDDYSLWDQGYEAVITNKRDWLYSSIGSSVVKLSTFDLVVLAPPGQEPFGWRASSPEAGEQGILPDDLYRSITGLIDATPNPGEAARTLIAEFDDGPWIFAVSKMTPVEGMPLGREAEPVPIQIHGYRMIEERFGRVGSDVLVNNLHFNGGVDPHETFIPIRDHTGRTISKIVWDAPRPGDSVLRKAAVPLSLALAIATVISAISSLYAVRSARSLERALIAAKEADRIRMEFLSNVSHELRTPMNGVLGATQLLETTALDPEQREYAGLLRSSANAQMALISDLIDFSRIDSGNRRPDEAPFRPEQVLCDVCAMMRVAADQKSIRIVTDWDLPGLLVLRGDGQALRQILTNLIGNAVKFTDKGAVTVTATAAETSERVTLTVAVADTGIGMPAAAVPRIFDRFYQVDGSLSRRAEGTGLGLAISRKLAQALGGDIEVRSVYGSGSTFTFTASFARATDTAEARDAA